ncbi:MULTISPECIES: hypothetical protein [Mesorhizobium]|uniref:hypothetical protein n=1 Tax=Mesorhizobium australicum TaxID=536018 RepID=UPI00333B3FB2
MAETERRREFTASLDTIDAKLDTLEALETAKPKTFDDGVAAGQSAAQAVVEVCTIANAPVMTMVNLVNKQATVTEAVAAVRHLAN